MCLMYGGWAAAIISGLGMPSFVFLIGNVLDAFNDNTESPDQTLDHVKTLSGIFGIIGLGVWLSSYIYYACLLSFSEKVTKKIKVKYLEAILKQESSWFDLTNPQELSARLGKECLAIAKALGEKMGSIIMGVAMTVSGLAFAFAKGWSFSLVIMGSFPSIMIATGLLTKIMQSGF